MSIFASDVQVSIPRVVRDPENIRTFLSENLLMPYAGTTASSSHLTLTLLYDLQKMSPAKEMVINFITRNGFEGSVDLCNMGIPGLKMNADDQQISDEKKVSIAQALLKAGFSFDIISPISQRHILDKLVCGNMYLEYEEINVGSSKRVELNYLHPKQCFYIGKKRATEFDQIAVFKYEWSMKDEGKRNYETVKVYPEFTKTGRGRKTIIHLKDLKDSNDLYGRPKDYSCIMPMYVQYCNYDLAAKVSNKEIVTKYILAFQKPEMGISNPDGQTKANAKKVRSILQRKNEATIDMDGNMMVYDPGTSDTIAMIDYDGDKAPTPIKLDIMRDTKWSHHQRVSTTHDICLVNGVHPDLIGFSDSNGNANSKSGEFILQLYKTTDISLIRPLQDQYSLLWNKVFMLMGEYLGNDDLKNISVKFPAKITQMIKESVDVHNSVRQDGKLTNENGDPIVKVGEKTD